MERSGVRTNSKGGHKQRCLTRPCLKPSNVLGLEQETTPKSCSFTSTTPTRCTMLNQRNGKRSNEWDGRLANRECSSRCDRRKCAGLEHLKGERDRHGLTGVPPNRKLVVDFNRDVH